MKRIFGTVLFLLLTASTAYSQTNGCGTNPTPIVQNPSDLYVQLVEFTQVDPNKNPIIADLTLEIRGPGQAIVQTFPLLKTAFTLQTGTPVSCYKFTFPTVTATLDKTITYQVALKANNMIGSSVANVSVNGFFLQGVPAAPTSLRLALLNTLSKLYQQVLSTVNSKSWFQRIGR